MAGEYEFVTLWTFDAPVERVWKEIKDSEEWPEWWMGVLDVEELRPGDEDGVGKVVRSTWKSRLPYKLVFDSEVIRVEYLRVIEARASGELQGTGIWKFLAEGENRTSVEYEWHVKTEKAWMNILRPVAEPFFRWNHDAIMDWGGSGLAKRLGCKLL